MKIPTAKQFERALRAMPEPPESVWQLIFHHYCAQGRVMTMRRLAEIAGYRTYGGANLQYGSFAAELAKRLKWKSGLRRSARVYLLVDFIRPGYLSNSEYLLVMREEFAKGLELAGWV